MKRSLMIARFPGGDVEHPDCVDWLLQAYAWAKDEPTISEIGLWRMNDTPVSMSRNAAIATAQHKHFDYVLMVDSDMAPDCEPGGKPFLPTAWQFALAHDGPCLVGAPYCSGPPIEKALAYRWNAEPNGTPRLEEYSREEAAQRTGIERVAALATGLMLIDMRAIAKLTPPYFHYEFTDSRQVRKASTEDIVFTRDLSIAGVPLFINWESWAGHWKAKLVRKPEVLHVSEAQSRLATLLRTREASNAPEAIPPVAPVVAADPPESTEPQLSLLDSGD
ncbi:hypothetical protein [Tuwongella immobilis]|uniref:Glycosyltransferase n=1 Tax=Tuwongella immobilis TaxID=692036 RepID=A0A6C2YQP5_9BACT|nr:hypothetical protein [Tuwongella immobilis]VIP03968.1 unnamed protein product [Tuwongella immobilis]VTS05303.1 unnamed protein product [Tuwongella immobilis]